MKLYTYTMDKYGREIILKTLDFAILMLKQRGTTDLHATQLREAILVRNEIMNLSEQPKQNTLDR